MESFLRSPRLDEPQIRSILPSHYREPRQGAGQFYRFSLPLAAPCPVGAVFSRMSVPSVAKVALWCCTDRPCSLYDRANGRGRPAVTSATGPTAPGVFSWPGKGCLPPCSLTKKVLDRGLNQRLGRSSCRLIESFVRNLASFIGFLFRLRLLVR